MTIQDSKILLSSISKMLFDSHIFGLYSGSISTKVDHSTIVINKKKCFFADVDAERFCDLSIENKNYNWRLAGVEANMHLDIYNAFHEAKFIITAMPHYVSLLMFKVDEIVPKDYFGKTLLKKLIVHKPKKLECWYDDSSEIMTYFENSQAHIVIIRGIGVYAYGRDLQELIKQLAVLEESCRLLLQDYK